MIDIMSQFDILPVHFTTVDGNDSQSNNAHSYDVHCYNASEDSRAKAKGSDNNSSTDTESLLDKYFQDQRDKKQKI